MRSKHLSTVLVMFGLAALSASAASAQSATYTSAQVTAGNAVQLSYHASAHKSGCVPGPLPNIRVLIPPKSGSLVVRRGTLTTDKIAGCPQLKTPAEVVFYQANASFTGTDHVSYVVTDANGPNGFDVTITVKPAPPNRPTPNPPAKPQGTPL